MDRNIALIRYRRFDGDLLLLEQLTSTTSSKPVLATDENGAVLKAKSKTVTDHLAAAGPEMLDRFHLLSDFLNALGDDVQTKTLDNYIAFRRIKNFACVELRNQLNKILIYVKVDPETVQIEESFTRDMRNKGHYGTGDLEIAIRSDTDFEKAKPLLERSYHEA